MFYKTLIISPHCDDEVLGCGGAIKNRDNVFVYYLGVEDFHIVTREERLTELDKVAKYLGFEYAIINNPVNQYSKHQLISQLTEIINQIKPEEIFIPNPSYNQDHREVYDSCMVALRPHDQNHFVKRVFVYEVDQYLLWGDSDFQPNYFEKIDIITKQNAYKLYQSQVREMRPVSLLKDYASIRGLSSGLSYAEGFKIIRFVKE